MFSSWKTLYCLMFFSCIFVHHSKGDGVKGYDPPLFCSAKIDCPKYDVIQSGKEFEIRNYNQALWVTAPPVTQYSIMGGIAKAAKNLIKYYYKGNDQAVNIISTGPVSFMDVFNSTYKLYFYVPYKFQNGGLLLPKPLSPEIEQVKLPKYKYAAVRRHRGDVTEEEVIAQVGELKKNLQATPFQQAASRDQFTFALYNQFEFGPVYEVLIWFN